MWDFFEKVYLGSYLNLLQTTINSSTAEISKGLK